MINFAFRAVSFFWILSPVIFLIGRLMGVWNFKLDIFIFAGLMVMSGLAAFLNYEPEE